MSDTASDRRENSLRYEYVQGAILVNISVRARLALKRSHGELLRREILSMQLRGAARS